MSIKDHFRTFLSVSICLLAAISVAHAQYSGGSGEPDDPYRIATAADLIALGETPEDYDKHFILTADIDLDPNLPGRKVFDRAVIAPDVNDGEEWFQGTPFTGVFDGNCHTVLNLAITGRSHLGLFGRLGSWNAAATVKNLGAVSVNIAGSGSHIGGLVGINSGNAIKCFSTGEISGDGYVGGLAGKNDSGSVRESYSGAAVTGWHSVGGLAGENNWGSITECHSTGTVRGSISVGGLVGNNTGLAGERYGRITASYSTGNVRGIYCVGGLVGSNDSSIRESYSASLVIGDVDVGGLVGHNHYTNRSGQIAGVSTSGSIVLSYSTGEVYGEVGVGGLVGRNAASDILISYSTSRVRGHSDVGGLVGIHTRVKGGWLDLSIMVGVISMSYSNGRATATGFGG